MKLIIPKGYATNQSVRETQAAINYVRDFVHNSFENKLNLERVSASLTVLSNSGLNDNLSGGERPVSFDVPDIGHDVEIVHSLAKWKRMALKQYGFKPGEGLFTEMNAIRRDEELDNTHSIYADQWDWERVITYEERNINTLVKTATQLFNMLRDLEDSAAERFPGVKRHLPSELFVLSAQELIDAYPQLTEKEREDAICRKHGAVLLTQIGDIATNGERHGHRAPDYDDWTMNGDLIVYNPLLDCAFEISSMGVRVDAAALASQLEKANNKERLELPYHRAVMENQLPYTIGGGLGQSRICMFILDKAHVGEVQASVWPQEMMDLCEQAGIHLL